MTFSDVFLPVPFLASPFGLHRDSCHREKSLRETEVQRRRGTTSPDPEKIPEPLRGPLGGFDVGIPRGEKTP